MTTYKLVYDPAEGTCSCGRQLDPVRVELDSIDRCQWCFELDDHWSDMADFAAALNCLDTYLRAGGDQNGPWLVEDIARIVFAMFDHRVPQGPEEQLVPDDVFVRELLWRAFEGEVRKVPEGWALEAVRLLLPDMTPERIRELLERYRTNMAHHAAHFEAQHVQVQIAALLLSRVPEGNNVREAVSLLGVDFERLAGLLMTKSAESGTPIDDLPHEVVDECFAAAKAES